MADDTHDSKALIGFSLGPVQSFIAQARTVRDLWTGSYLVSWLTAHAAKAAIEAGAEIVWPSIENNPLFQFLCSKGAPADKSELLYAGIPNNFIAEADDKDRATICSTCRQAVCDEWKKIANAVHEHLKKLDALSEKIRKKYGVVADSWRPWDYQWKEQLEDLWSIYTPILPAKSDEEYRKAAEWHGIKVPPKGGDLFPVRMELAGRLLSVLKNARHYSPHASPNDKRPKCIQTGEHAQMCPLPLDSASVTPMQVSDQFWSAAPEIVHGHWERMQKKDRFGAPALVKRFAWSRYLHKELCMEPKDKRVWDAATIAAMEWLSRKEIKSPEDQQERPLHESIEELLVKENSGVLWSGQWLHWSKKDRDKGEPDDTCPSAAWKEIVAARNRAVRAKVAARPPIYYAVFACDGDKMGEHQRDCPRDRLNEISSRVLHFANQVPRTVEKECLGTLVYAGGEDVLALLPCSKALDLAQRLNAAYRKAFEDLPPLENKGKFTLSAGIAIVHYKHDLQEAIRAAQAAETIAKNSGRDRLAISILSGQGESYSGVMRWDGPPESGSEKAAVLQRLMQRFLGRSSDKWLYAFHDELEAFTNPAMADGRFTYLLDHSEGAPKNEAKQAWPTYTNDTIEYRDLELPEGSPDDEYQLSLRKNALKLMFAASFMARGSIKE